MSEAERLYRLLVDSVRDYAIFALDAEGRVATWNAGAEQIKGYEPEEIIGRHYRTFFIEEARERGEPELQLEAAKRRGHFEAEGWRCRKDGSRFWAYAVLTALHDDDGALIGFGKVTADKTAERTARRDLLERERQLQEAQEIAHLGSWSYDVEAERVVWSDQLFRIFGMDPADSLDYEAYLDRLDPADRAQVREKLERSLETGEPYRHEHQIERADGEQRWIESRGEVVRDDAGRAIRLVGTTLDITELKEAEARARELASEQAARAEAERTAQRMGFLAEASALLTASLNYEETLSTVAWLAVPSFADWCAVDMVAPGGGLNRLAVAHLDPEQVELAKQVHESFPPDPDALSGVHAVLRSGEPELLASISPGMLRDWARDEEHRELLEQLELRSAILVPIRIRDRTLGVVSFAYAESERRYSRDDLVVAQELAGRAALAIENAQLHSAERDARQHAERASERMSRLQAITAGLSEAVTPQAVAEVIVDQGVAALGARSGTLVLVRGDQTVETVRSVGIPARVLGAYERFELDAGIPLAEAIRTGKLVLVEDVADREARYPEISGVREETGTGAMVAVPLPSGSGVLGSLGFGYTEERQFHPDDQAFLEALGRQCAQALERAWLYETEHMAREAAEEASRAKSQFVAMMSHELRTPLSAIIGYQELLSEEVTGPVNEAQRQQLERINVSATHLRDLINQILSLSRIEAGKEEVRWEEIDLSELAREVTVMMEREVEAAALDLRLSAPDELRIETDQGKVRQIMINLLSNAVKFTEQGSITVTVESDPEEARVRVEDTGEGIDPAHRERIFEAFTQVDQSMTRSTGGSGLGLAVSQRLARLLEGRVTLETEVGEGSAFTLHLPLNR